MKHLTLLSLLASGLLLSSCTGIAIGAGATAGVAAAQEGGISRALSDARIQTQINDLWFRHDVEMFRKIDMTVNQGRVLLTGVVQDSQHRVEAVRLSWQPVGVKQVINEVKIANSEGVVGFAKDAWISARLRAAITLDRDVESVNYTIDTVQGSVYLMGLAQNQAELNRVIDIARTIENVKQVVSYVKLAGTPEITEPAPGNYAQGPSGDVSYVEPAAGDAGATGDPVTWNKDSLY
jgi:osmotically-inducible protein OsmY